MAGPEDFDDEPIEPGYVRGMAIDINNFPNLNKIQLESKKRKASKDALGFYLISPFVLSATVAIGHHILPELGLASLAAGGGSLSVAAISMLASGGILVLPTVVFYTLINEKIENKFARNVLNVLLFIGYGVGNFFLAANLYGIQALPLLMQGGAGGLTGLAVVVAVILLGSLVSYAYNNCSGSNKVMDSNSGVESSSGLGRHGIHSSKIIPDPVDNSSTKEDDNQDYFFK